MSQKQKVALSQTFFMIGIMLGLVLFVGANMYSYIRAVPPCCDFEIGFGVPFQLGRHGGYAGQTNFVLSGMIIDALVGLGASLVFSWVFVKLLAAIRGSVQHTHRWHVKTCYRGGDSNDPNS